MPAEWTETTLGELIRGGEAHLQTGPFGTQLQASEYVEEGIPLVAVREIREGYIELGKETVRLSPDTLRRLPRFVLEPGDIVFARKGGTDRNAIIHEHQRGWFLGSDGIRLRLSKKYDSRFFSYVVRNPATRAWLRQHSEGTTMPSVNQEILSRIPISIPPIEEQRTIASVLGALDDKIELNRRMNATLEAMAQAVFKEWFLDKDPDDQGWERTTLGAAANVIESGRRPAGGVKGILSGVPSVGAESIVGLGLFDFTKTKYVPREYFESMNRGHVQDMDVLLYKDGGRPGLFEPHVTMVGNGFPFAEYCINEHVYRIRTEPTLPQSYLYFWLASDACMEEMRNRGTGAAIPGLNSSAVRELAILKPSAEALERFSALVDPMIARILANCNESRTLAALRDTLLPKLMRGEVRVKSRSEAATLTLNHQGHT